MQGYKDKLVRDFRSTDELDRLTEAYMRVINGSSENKEIKKEDLNEEKIVRDFRSNDELDRLDRLTEAYMKVIKES
jgi:hypothetical protein